MRTIGIPDKEYEQLRSIAEQANISLTAALQTILEYALPKVKVRTETRLVMDDDRPLPSAEQVVAARRLLHADKAAAPDIQSPAMAQTQIDTSTYIGKVKAILDAAGRPLNLFEIKQAWRDNFPETPLPANLGANMQNSSIRNDRSVIPHVYSFSPDGRGGGSRIANKLKGKANEQTVVKLIGQGHFQFTDLVEHSGLTSTTLATVLQRLTATGRVIKQDKGIYGLPNTQPTT